MIKAHGQACSLTQVGLTWNVMMRMEVQPKTIMLRCRVESLVMGVRHLRGFCVVRPRPGRQGHHQRHGLQLVRVLPTHFGKRAQGCLDLVLPRQRRCGHHQRQTYGEAACYQRALDVEHNSRRRGRTHSKAECYQLALELEPNRSST